MQISEYSFYRLYQEHEDQITRDLEFRRVANERTDEKHPAARRVTMFQPLSRWLSHSLSGVRHSSLTPAPPSQLDSSR